jgi:hypothetical protein
MKDLHKNPVLYYIGVPVLVAVWPLLVWSHYLPGAHKDLATWKGWFPDVNALAGEILRLDPDRLADGTPIVTERFDYLTAITRSASLCNIPPGSYSHQTGFTTKSSKGQQSQTATVTIKGVSVVQACRFLSTLEVSWPHLECTAIDLTQDKKVSDQWDVKLGFQYFYN